MPTKRINMTRAQKDMHNAACRRWHERNREAVIASKKRHYHANRDKYLAIERERSYRKLYGITTADYDEMFEKQNGKCAICGTERAAAKRSQVLCVDHCHETGKVRGLLCVRCNGHLGWLEKCTSSITKYLQDA